MNKSKKIYCINCDETGHSSKNCTVPITSYGIILLSFDINEKLKKNITNNFRNNENSKINSKIDDSINGISINGSNDIELFCALKNSIRFLLIRRKHTLGFLEFIRGRYSIDNVDGIIFLFKQMTPEEIKKISVSTFDELWCDVWGNKGEGNKMQTYQNEYLTSREKFNKLKNDASTLNLNFYTENVVPVWNYAEWGFPKGRRNMKEKNVDCAIREFKEESGLNGNNDFILLDGIDPIEETLIGTNGINYRHIYYLAVSNSQKIPKIDPQNNIQMDEIGDIKYMSYEDSIKVIRSHHTERQKIITQIYIYFINYLITAINSKKL